MEIWDLYDENRQLLPFSHVRGIPLPPETYHLVTDIWTINHENKILITKRHLSKKHGGLWECSGGAAQQGEISIHSALRELAEETGIQAKAEDLVLLHSQKILERFVDTYITKQAITLADITLQAEEVIDARFVTFAELVALWESGHLVPRERFGLYKERIAEFISTTRG